MDDCQRLDGRITGQINARFRASRQRALAANNEAAEVAAGDSQHFVEVVTSDAPHDLWIAGVDFLPVLGDQLLDGAIDSPFEIVGRAFPQELFSAHVRKTSFAAIGEHQPQLADMVDGDAVQDGMCPGRVIPDHSSERRTIAGRDIGRKSPS